MFGIFKKKNNFESQVVENLSQLIASKEEPIKAFYLVTSNPYYFGFLIGNIKANLDLFGSGLNKEERDLCQLRIIEGVLKNKGELILMLFQSHSQNPLLKQGIEKGYLAACYAWKERPCINDPDYGKALSVAKSFFYEELQMGTPIEEFVGVGFTLIWFTESYRRDLLAKVESA